MSCNACQPWLGVVIWSSLAVPNHTPVTLTMLLLKKQLLLIALGADTTDAAVMRQGEAACQASDLILLGSVLTS